MVKDLVSVSSKFEFWRNNLENMSARLHPQHIKGVASSTHRQVFRLYCRRVVNQSLGDRNHRIHTKIRCNSK